MKPILRWVALFASFASLSIAVLAQDNNGPLQQNVLQLEQRWEDALVHSDVAALEKLYDDGIVYTHSNGKVDTKASYINAIKTGATKYESMKRDDIKVSVYGTTTALVTCHWQVKVGAPGNPSALNARYLHVYVQQKDGWKLVAHESTRIP
jgi:ketosteroid isomerase-like protein